MVNRGPVFHYTPINEVLVHTGQRYVGPSDILALQPRGYLLATVHRAENTDNSQRFQNTLRDETEWIETVALEWNILTSGDRDRIIETVRVFKTPADIRPFMGSAGQRYIA